MDVIDVKFPKIRTQNNKGYLPKLADSIKSRAIKLKPLSKAKMDKIKGKPEGWNILPNKLRMTNKKQSTAAPTKAKVSVSKDSAAKLVPIGSKNVCCDVNQLFTKDAITKPSAKLYQPVRNSSGNYDKSRLPGSANSSERRFGLICKGKSSHINPIKQNKRQVTAVNTVKDLSASDWSYETNQSNPVPLLKLPTITDNNTTVNEQCSIINLALPPTVNSMNRRRHIEIKLGNLLNSDREYEPMNFVDAEQPLTINDENLKFDFDEIESKPLIDKFHFAYH